MGTQANKLQRTNPLERALPGHFTAFATFRSIERHASASVPRSSGVCIMIGAVTVTLITGGGATALIPFATGCLAAFVAYGRWKQA